MTTDVLLRRRSTRRFSNRPVEEEKIRELLECAMSAPSCVNARDWCFLVVREKETLWKMAEANGRPAEPLKGAPLGILVCGDLDRAFAKAKDYWIIDCAAAAENLSVAAEAMGLGCVWLGTWPQQERVKRQTELFGLPETIVPHSVLAVGYPAEPVETTIRSSRYEEDRVHFEKW